MNVNIQWSKVDSIDDLEAAPDYPRAGIYIWTYGVGDKERIYYIGSSTKSIGGRISKEVRQVLSGPWWTYNLGAEADLYDVLVKNVLGQPLDTLDRSLPDLGVYRPPSARISNMLKHDFSGGHPGRHRDFLNKCHFYLGVVDPAYGGDLRWIEADFIVKLRQSFQRRHGVLPITPGGNAGDNFFGRAPLIPPDLDRSYRHSPVSVDELLLCK